jgi:hypothetical protein
VSGHRRPHQDGHDRLLQLGEQRSKLQVPQGAPTRIPSATAGGDCFSPTTSNAPAKLSTTQDANIFWLQLWQADAARWQLMLNLHHASSTTPLRHRPPVECVLAVITSRCGCATQIFGDADCRCLVDWLASSSRSRQGSADVPVMLPWMRRRSAPKRSPMPTGAGLLFVQRTAPTITSPGHHHVVAARPRWRVAGKATAKLIKTAGAIGSPRPAATKLCAQTPAD